MQFNQKTFYENLLAILRADYAKEIKNATAKELYNAVSKAIMSHLYDDWKKSEVKRKKRCGYLSAEFLVGRAIYSNLLNLGVLEEVKEALAKEGVDINTFEEIEDAALGNGGLGRLAACYLESAASHDIPLDGYGLRYRYGLFKQSFVDGFQNEEGDDWLKWGDPWGVRKEDEAVIVSFSDFAVSAVPYDMPVIGYQNGVVNTLRLWQSEPINNFEFSVFDNMKGRATAKKNFRATSITDVLYPNDNTDDGKLLRLRQQYFMVSASLQDIVRKVQAKGGKLTELYKMQTLQLNDTHPVLAIPELIRILQKEGLAFGKALDVCKKTFNFTNHTIMGEALERWQGKMVRKILPEIWKIMKKIQQTLEKELLKTGESADEYYIIKDDVVHMANLAIYVAEKVNGVAQIHTGILKENTFRNWDKKYPEKIINVTNGITPRRWFLQNNPEMAKEIDKRIGNAWHTNLPELKEIEKYVHDQTFREAFVRIKGENKRALAQYILENEGIDIPSHFIFDVQIKRMHEYKRQLLNAFSILYIYNGIKSGEIKNFQPTAFIFGAKSAPGYYNAKAIIKYINEIAKLVNNDKEVADKMRVVFVQNYNVSYAEKIVCASDISEQISMAGMEASGTGNMKFMLNGTVTLGTMDGANVEICEEAGRENNYIFGATVEEVAEVKKTYIPKEFIKTNPALEKIVNTLVDGTFEDNGTGVLKAVYDSLFGGWSPDHYLVLYDFQSYMDMKLRLNAEYGTEAFTTKCLMNLSNAGKFSSDRSVQEYAKEIWKL